MKRGRVSSQAVDAVRAGKSQRGEHGRRQLRTRIESDEEPETAVQPAKGVSCSASGTGSGSEDEGLSAKMLLALERARARANGESAHAQKPVSAPKPVKPIDEDDWFMDRKVEEDGPTELPSSPLKGLSPSPVPERTRSPSPVVSRKQITPETGKRQPSRASSSSQEERSRTPERKWRQQPAEAKRSPTPQKRATPSPEPPVPVSVRRSPSPVARRSPSPLARELTPPLPLSVNLLLNFTEADPQRPREVTPSPPRPGAVAAHSTLPIPAAVPTVDPRFVEPGLHTKARHEDGNTYDVEILGAPVDGNVHVWWTQQGRPGNIPLAALHLPTAPQPVPAMHFHAHMHMHAPVMPPAPPAASSSSSDSDSSSSSSSSDDAAINDLIDRSKKRKKDEKKKKKKKKAKKEAKKAKKKIKANLLPGPQTKAASTFPGRLYIEGTWYRLDEVEPTKRSMKVQEQGSERYVLGLHCWAWRFNGFCSQGRNCNYVHVYAQRGAQRPPSGDQSHMHVQYAQMQGGPVQ